MAQQTRIVIIGAGPGGITLTQGLSGHADVKLVDGKAFSEIIWAGVRCPVQPNIADISVINYTDIPKVKDCFVHAKATGVTSSHVKLSTGQELPFDILIFSFGAQYADKLICTTEGTAEQRRQQYKSAYQTLSTARSVLVVGGGPLGVELACEIKGAMKEKKVTLVQSGPLLLAGQPARISARALSATRKQGIEVILNDKALPVDGKQGMFKLASNGQEIQADVVYRSGGIKPFSDWLKPQHASSLDQAGYVKVNEHFQVEGHSNWFAVGDCTNIPDWKMGLQAKLQAGELLKTLHSILKVGPENAVYQKHKPFCGMKAMIVTLGKYDAVMNVSGWSLPWFLPRWLKCGDLLIGQTRSDLGLQKLPMPKPVAAY